MAGSRDSSADGTPRQTGAEEVSSGSNPPAASPRSFFATLFRPRQGAESSTRALGEASGGAVEVSQGMAGLQIGGGEGGSSSGVAGAQRKRSREEGGGEVNAGEEAPPEPVLAPAPAPGQVRIQCPVCGRDDFDSVQSLGGHMRAHERNWRGINPPPVFSRDEFHDVQHLLNKEGENVEETEERVQERIRREINPLPGFSRDEFRDVQHLLNKEGENEEDTEEGVQERARQEINPPPVFSRDEFRDVQHLLNKEGENEEDTEERVQERTRQEINPPPVFSRDEFHDVQHLLNKEEESEEEVVVPPPPVVSTEEDKPLEGVVVPPPLPAMARTEEDKTGEEVRALTEGTGGSVEAEVIQGHAAMPADGDGREVGVDPNASHRAQIPDLNEDLPESE